MALQIANPSVVNKVERLARRTGLSKTAAVEQAVDRMLKDLAAPGEESARMAALLAQLDRMLKALDAYRTTTSPRGGTEGGGSQAASVTREVEPAGAVPADGAAPVAPAATDTTEAGR